jgi:photosystem I P700 chlorophyll a apoprotein A1
MFLSVVGYWQELIESIYGTHNKIVAPAIQPRALSITQGRAVGVTVLGGIVNNGHSSCALC